MRWRALVGLGVAIILLCTIVVAVAQDAGEGAKREPPRFFFEKKGGLAKPEQPAGEEEQPGKGEAEGPAVEGPARPPETAVAVPPTFDFEAEGALARWTATDGEAILDITRAEGAAHGGNGCLRLTYMPREGAFQQLSATPLQVMEGKTLSFWVKTDLPTPLSFGVVEDTGAFYQQFCATPADQWTQASVPLSSLILSQDTRDNSGRLEVASIREIRIQELSNLPGALGDVLGRKAGVQQLFVDDVAITDEEAPQPGVADPDVLLVDGFERGAIHALAIGGALLSTGEGAEGSGLVIECPGRDQRWMGLVMGVGHLNLRDRETLSLHLKSSQPVLLSIVLEERDGSKYAQRFRLDPEAGWTSKDLAIDQLLLETDSEDENQMLDRDQVRVLIIVADTTPVAEFPLTIGVDEIAFK
jgi:hypothetical protein